MPCNKWQLWRKYSSSKRLVSPNSYKSHKTLRHTVVYYLIRGFQKHHILVLFSFFFWQIILSPDHMSGNWERMVSKTEPYPPVHGVYWIMVLLHTVPWIPTHTFWIRIPRTVTNFSASQNQTSFPSTSRVSDSVISGWGSTICILTNLDSGDASAAGPGTTLWQPLA